jgi:hypothetical protein
MDSNQTNIIDRPGARRERHRNDDRVHGSFSVHGREQPATFSPTQTHLCNGTSKVSRMASIWFFRAYGPVIVEFVGVVLVAVGARGLARKDDSRHGNIRSKHDGRS